MVTKPEYYPWSSYYLYKYPKAVPAAFMKTETLVDYYKGTMEQKKEKYCMSVNTEACHAPVFVDTL